MKLTTTKLKKLIKEELEEMMHTQQRYDQAEMDAVPDRKIPQIEKFKNLQKRLERHYGDHQPAVAAQNFDDYDVDPMEDLAYKLASVPNPPDDFIGFIRDVVNELNA